MTRFANFGSRGAPRADLHRKPPSTMGHESLIQRRPSLGQNFGIVIQCLCVSASHRFCVCGKASLVEAQSSSSLLVLAFCPKSQLTYLK